MTHDLNSATSWPFEQARKVAARIEKSKKTFAQFQTGYGPSGLPHIGTFGEVARTSWVRGAFTQLTGVDSSLLAFSDDMDALRSVPDNVPNKEMLEHYIGQPLTSVPDPFETHESFGHHNNARLRSFLDRFGFEYEFASSTDYYQSGRFDAALLIMAERHDAILKVILPTLGIDRRATYSPFLPIHPETGIVMQVPMVEVNAAEDKLTWIDPNTGVEYSTKITGGHCKAQWKADWALRWFALGIDYEMSGKDLIDSVKLSSAICKILGQSPPETFTYELFLDESGHKISKSKGNGLSVDDWLSYAPKESLLQFMYNQPQRAKKLYFDQIPKSVDEYIQHNNKLLLEIDVDNPAWHINSSVDIQTPITFTMLLNLVNVTTATDPAMLWEFLKNYLPNVSSQTHPFINSMIVCAITYNARFVKNSTLNKPTVEAANAIGEFINQLEQNQSTLLRLSLDDMAKFIDQLIDQHSYEEFQTVLYNIIGKQSGPAFGKFISMYGLEDTIKLLDESLL